MQKQHISTVGSTVKRLRQKQGWTLQRLAAESGISKQYLSQLEASQESNPSEKVIRILANALGVTVSDLIGETSPDEYETYGRRIPQSLREFANEANLTRQEIDMLAGIKYRGNEPGTIEQWRTIYRFLRAILGENER